MIKISPSILTADFSKIPKYLKRFETANIDYVHLDVMDNNFVDNLTFGPKFISDIKSHTNLPFDIHLMINKPEKHINNFLKTKGEIYTIHIESSKKIKYISEIVKKEKKKFGLSLKPKTPIKSIIPHLNYIDIVLIMTVNPGFGGQKFINSSIEKIKNCKEILNQNNKNIEIQVDGGINQNNSKKIISSGANILVIGSDLIKQENYSNYINKIKSAI